MSFDAGAYGIEEHYLCFESELAAEDVFAKRTDVLSRQMDEVRVRIESLKVKINE